MSPFFSICIPTTDRGKTIYSTLCSVAHQTYRDFELIIVDSGSKDNTRDEIARFFKSEVYSQNVFSYIYKELEGTPVGVEDWNVPVKLAKGRYIAMLEGDDQFLPDHLFDAHRILIEYPNIGMYAESNQHHQRLRQGLIKSTDWVVFAMSCVDPAPPSEAIFRRINNESDVFLYNDKDYEYAPEIDLYVRIALSGFDAYHSGKTGVFRDVTPKNRTTWHYFVDLFTLFEKNKDSLPRQTRNKILNNHLRNTMCAALTCKSYSNFKDISQNILKRYTVKQFFIGFFLAEMSIVNSYYKRGIRIIKRLI